MAVEDLTGVGKVFETIVAAVEKAIGGIFAPFQIKRIGYAEAEVEAYKIEKRAEAEKRALMIGVEAEDKAIVRDDDGMPSLTIRDRAAQRLIAQEVSHQQNIESIVNSAMERAVEAEVGVENGEKPEPRPIDADWMNSFLDYAQNVSADDLQDLWSRILVSQATQDKQLVSRAALDSMRLLESQQARMLDRAVRLYAGMGQIIEIDAMDGRDIAYFPHMHEAIALEDLGILKSVRDIEVALTTHFGVLTFWEDEILEPSGERKSWHSDLRNTDFPSLLSRIGRKPSREQRQYRKDLRIERQILSSRGFELAPTILPDFLEMFQSEIEDQPQLGEYGSVEVRLDILNHWASKLSAMGAAIVLNQTRRVNDSSSGVQNDLVMTHLFDPVEQTWVDLQKI